MGVLFLILFIVLEVALVVMTFTKCSQTEKWLKNRALVTATEFLLLLLIVVLPLTYAKWRFVCALIVLFLRLTIAGLRFFIKGKRATGIVKKSGKIVSCVLVIMLMTFSLVPSFLFANYNGLDVTGKYQFKECNAILVDENRIDELDNDGSNREVPVHFYYPDAKGEFPLVIFSHGAFGYYQSNFSTYAELASNGYVVVALDHPHHAFFTKDSSGNIVIADMKFFENAMNFGNPDFMTESEAFGISREWMKIRVEDENFVIDTIKEAKNNSSLNDSWVTETESDILSVLSSTDCEEIGLIGHSMGGATSVALGRERNDIDAVIDLDGSMLSEIKNVNNGKFDYNSEPYPVPVLDFRKKSDYNEMEKIKNNGISADEYAYGFAYVNNHTVEKAVNGKTVVFNNAGHMNFTDLPMFSPALSSLLGTGDVDGQEFMYTINSVVLNWFDYYLKGEGTLNIKAEY